MSRIVKRIFKLQESDTVHELSLTALKMDTTSGQNTSATTAQETTAAEEATKGWTPTAIQQASSSNPHPWDHPMDE